MSSLYGTLTVGEFIRAIEEWIDLSEKDQGGRRKAEKEHVMFSFGWAYPTKLDGYRGSYDQLALGYKAGGDHTADKPATVGDLLKELKGCVGKEYTGWKGGEYKMTLNTPVWVDNPGHCSSTQIVGIERSAHLCILITRYGDAESGSFSIITGEDPSEKEDESEG